MNNSAETSFRKWLIDLMVRTHDLKNRIDGMPTKQLEKEFGFLVAFWEQISEFKQRQNIDVSRYESQMFELEKDHAYIALVLERRSKELFDKHWINSLVDKFEFFGNLLRDIGLPVPFDLLIKVLIGIRGVTALFLNSPPPVPLLPNPKYDFKKSEEKRFGKAKPFITNDSLRPPRPLDKFKTDQTFVYKSFSVTRLLLRQDYLRENKKGMLIEIDVKFHEVKDVNCIVEMSFWYANGKPIMNSRQNIQAKLEKAIKPETENYDMKKLKFFILYSTLGVGLGIYKCKLRINAFRTDTGKPIGNPQDTFFELIDPLAVISKQRLG